MKNARSQTAQEWVSEKYDFRMRNVEVGIVVQFPKILLKMKLKAIEFPLSEYFASARSEKIEVKYFPPLVKLHRKS